MISCVIQLKRFRQDAIKVNSKKKIFVDTIEKNSGHPGTSSENVYESRASDRAFFVQIKLVVKANFV